MTKDQFFTDMVHIAYAGYVPKAELEKIAGKPSWGNDSSIHGEDYPPTGAEGIEDETEMERHERLCYIRDNK